MFRYCVRKGVRGDYIATVGVIRHKEDPLLYFSNNLDKERGGTFVVSYNATSEIYGDAEHIEN